MKCKPIPVQIPTIEHIRFIASGSNHSLAISSDSQFGVQSSTLYTWGLSSYGQLGHHDVKNQYNLNTPKAVKFLNDPDVKMVFVSASQKHTLCVDSEGELWFFGDKQSVGIQDKRNKYQFSPIRLVASNHNKYSRDEKRFRFIAAGVNNNMVISMINGEIYNFGQDVSRPQEINEAIIEEDDIEESVRLSQNLNQKAINKLANIKAATFFKK